MVSRLVRENLTRRASRFNLVLEDVSITHVTFSPAFSDAVEAKQIAQQTAQRAVYLVDQALQEKQSIIVKAQGEARSAELIGEAVKQNKGFLQLRRLEAAREMYVDRSPLVRLYTDDKCDFAALPSSPHRTTSSCLTLTPSFSTVSHILLSLRVVSDASYLLVTDKEVATK